ncbi:RING-type E3 ubiquitin transferase [Ranunculus cassubicifolius]
MAVQAQYLSSLNHGNVFCEDFLHTNGDLLGRYYNYAGQNIFNETMLSEAQSDLTCNNNGSRKRNRDDCHSQMVHQQPFRFPKLPKTQATSTSGRSSTYSPSTHNDLNSHFLHHQIQEIDSFILLENQKLQYAMREAQKKHSRSLLTVIEQQVLRKLQEKDNELVIARRRNAELEEKLRQMSAENQIWFNVAKNNESMVSTLKSSLEQILLQSQGQLKEGFGDSGSVDDDAQSCCNDDNNNNTLKIQQKRCCKVCKENEVSVLLLPCRHLCLCKSCDAIVDSCPICDSTKSASLQIFTC